MKYYFLASYLPDLSREDQKLKVALADLLDEKSHFAPADWQEIELVLLGGDVFILERLLARKSVPQDWPGAKFSVHPVEFWRDQVKSPKEGPEFLLEYLRELPADKFGPAEVDRLQAVYIDHVLAESRTAFLKGYFSFERDLRNVLAAVRARRQGLVPAEHLVGESDVAEALARSSAEDFGLSRDLPWLEGLASAKSPEEISQAVEKVLWEHLDENSGADPFDFSQILAYLLKLQILEKRLSESEEAGLNLISRLEGN